MIANFINSANGKSKMAGVMHETDHGDCVDRAFLTNNNDKREAMDIDITTKSKFYIEDGVKLVAIVAMSDFTKDYLIKQKIIPNNI